MAIGPAPDIQYACSSQNVACVTHPFSTHVPNILPTSESVCVRVAPVPLSPPRNLMKDVPGELLIRCSGDNIEALTNHLGVFHAQTTPIIGYHKKKNLWLGIDAAQSPSVMGDIFR
ncbi:hypothetical protein BJV74DRAFT_799076 [Russula compacta]|nr:hypothetical protein BJV74DRAFT_799076 [Russula compacta]